MYFSRSRRVFLFFGRSLMEQEWKEELSQQPVVWGRLPRRELLTGRQKEGAEVDRIGWECPLLAWRLGGPDLLECSTLVGIPEKVTEESYWQWRMNDETKVLMPLRIFENLAWRANQFYFIIKGVFWLIFYVNFIIKLLTFCCLFYMHTFPFPSNDLEHQNRGVSSKPWMWFQCCKSGVIISIMLMIYLSGWVAALSCCDRIWWKWHGRYWLTCYKYLGEPQLNWGYKCVQD